MNTDYLLSIASQFGVKNISLGGCNVELQKNGQLGRFRAQAHAHTAKQYQGYICFLTGKMERLIHNDKPTTLFWHEVAHVYRPSWNHEKVRKWANQMGRLPKNQLNTLLKEPTTPQDASFEKKRLSIPLPYKPLLKRDLAAVKLVHAQQMVKKYQTKVKRDTTFLKKWQKTLTRLERKGGAR